MEVVLIISQFSQPLAFKPKYSLCNTLLAASIISVPFGGLGGNYQASRLFFVLLLPFVLTRLFSRAPRTAFEKKSIVFILATIILGIFSLVWSVDRPQTLQSIVVLLVNCLPILMVSLLTQSEKQTLLSTMRYSWIIAATGMVAIAAYELATDNHLSEVIQIREIGGGAPPLAFAAGYHGNYNDFSTALAVCFVGLISKNEFLRKPHGAVFTRLWKFYVPTLLFLILAIMVANTSRSVLIFSVLLFFVRLPGNIVFRIMLLVTISMGLLATAAMLAEGNQLVEYVGLKFSDFSSDFESDSGRLQMLKGGIEIMLSTSGLGVGLGATTVGLSTLWYLGIPNPHNVFLEWALSFGIVGLGFLVWFCFHIWRVAKNNASRMDRRIARVAILLLPVIGVAQSNMIGYSYFWLLLVNIMVISTSNYRYQKPESGRVSIKVRHG